MVSAIVLMNVERQRVNEIAPMLADLPGVSEVYSVGGRWDLVALIRVATNEELANLVTGHLLKIEGITHTETLIAFRCHSKHDLEAMFAVGLT